MDPQNSTIDISAIVTPVAALSLDASGRFIIPAPASFEGLPLITAEQAGRLALANVATFGSQLSRYWDQQRGEPINIDNLRLGDQIYFASTPFHLIPDGYYPSHRREFGPYFLVPLVNGNTIVMIVAVSAFNTELRIDNLGRVHLPSLAGEEFIELVIPKQGDFSFLSPEASSMAAALWAGTRVNKAPELVLRGLHHPAHALWRVSLEHPVKARAMDSITSAARSISEIFISGDNRIFITSEAQPADQAANLFVPPWDKLRTVPVRVPIRTGSWLMFEEAVLEPAVRP
jgi:hypothetical protein